MFGSTIGVPGKDLFRDGGRDLLIKSLILIKWFSSAGVVLDCQEVDWGLFDVVLFASIGQ